MRPQRQWKDAVCAEMLIKLCEMLKESDDSLVIRDLHVCMILICFPGFLRNDESSFLYVCNDVKIFHGYIYLHISKSKTNIEMEMKFAFLKVIQQLVLCFKADIRWDSDQSCF